jgi:hypothetical protein
MEWSVIMALVVGAPLLLLLAAVTYYLIIGASYTALKEKREGKATI